MKIPNNKFTRYWWGYRKDGNFIEYLGDSWLAKMIFHSITFVLIALSSYSIWNLILVSIFIIILALILVSYAIDIEMNLIPEDLNKNNEIEELEVDKITPLIKESNVIDDIGFLSKKLNVSNIFSR